MTAVVQGVRVPEVAGRAVVPAASASRADRGGVVA